MVLPARYRRGHSMALCLLIALLLSKYTAEAFKGYGRGNAVLENMKNGAKDQSDHLSVNTTGVAQNSAKSDSHKKHAAEVTTERNAPQSSGTQGTGAGNSTSKKGGLLWPFVKCIIFQDYAVPPVMVEKTASIQGGA